MKRQIARARTWWIRLFVVAVLAAVGFELPMAVDVPLIVAPLLLAMVRPPGSTRPAVDLFSPVRGRWVAVNSPGTQVPSHGIRAYGQAYAIDLLHPAGPDTSQKLGWSLITRRPETYPCFGEPVHAMADGTVVAATGWMRDHRSRDTWPALVYLMLVEAFFRELGGARWILGNHVILEHGNGTFSAYAHLRHRSLKVRPGERVAAGQVLAEVGNTGNSTEPHLHTQVMDRSQPTAAAGLPFRWIDTVLRPDEVDRTRTTKPPAESAVGGVPPNGQIFTAAGTPATERA